MRNALGPLSRVERLTQPVLVGLLVAVAVSCGGESEGTPTTLDLPIHALVEDLRLGSQDGSDHALASRGTFLPILPDNKGNLWVLQHEEQQLRLHDVNGALVRTIGRMGEGPGEFMWAGGMGWWGGSTDTLWITDVTLRRVSLFEANGSFVRSFPMVGAEYGESFRIQMPQSFAVDGRALATASTKPGVIHDGPVPVLSYDAATGIVEREVATLSKGGALMIRWQGALVSTGPHPFSDAPLVSYAADGSRMIVVERSTAREAVQTVTVHALTPGSDTLWTRRFDYDPLDLPSTEVDSLLLPRIESFKRFTRLERRLSDEEAEQAYRNAVDVPGHRPPIRSVRAALDGRTWLEWSAPPGVPGDWWLLDSDGTPLMIARPPEPITVLDVAGDHLWAIELDELDVPYLVRYRVAVGSAERRSSTPKTAYLLPGSPASITLAPAETIEGDGDTR